MAEWKFGTVIGNSFTKILIIGKTDGTYKTTDPFRNTPDAGEWIGVTLADKEVGDKAPYGAPGDTTWVIPLSMDQWKVLDE